MKNKGIFWKRLISVALFIAVLAQMTFIRSFALDGNTLEFEGNGTESSPYLIASADDWDALSNHINNGGTEYTGKHFKLTKNISVSTVLGNRPNNSSDSNDNVFCGVFDGDGHTLNVNINNSGFAAPFAVAHNTTVKNLTVTGTVSSSSNHASGLVAAAKPKNAYESTYLNIQNVTVSADIRCNSHIAGIVGHAHKADITMENVVFDGSLNASSIQGGFIGWGGIPNEKYNATFKDCMFAGTYKSGAAFHPVGFANGQGTATLVNDFYTTSTGSGGNPIAPTGSGQVKLVIATVEKDGAVNYYTSISDAISGWKSGGKLTLLKDASYSSVINIRPMYGYNAGEYTLDLNGKKFNIQSVQVGLNNSPNTLRTGPHLIIEDNKTGGILCFSESGMIDYGGLIELRGGTLTGGNGTWGGLFLLHIYASLDMYDGVTLTGNTSTYGGAVLVGSDSQFNMYGGKISGNTASDSGGGVVVFDNDAARFNMYGGEISGNRAPKGGGVSVNVGSFHICGNNAIIKDNVNGGSFSSETATYNGGTPNNVYLPSGKKINIDSELSSTPVGITLQNGEGVITSGWSTYMSGKNPDDYFASDNANYGVILNGGEVEIGVKPHIHDDLSFTKWNSTISLPTTAGNYYLSSDITISSTWTVPSGNTKLCLNGHSIAYTGNTGSVLYVGSGRSLDIYECDKTVHYYDINGATHIAENINTAHGNYSFVGGYITGGKGYSYGGGLRGGAAYIQGGTVNIHGGAIIGNKASNGEGGGVYIDYGTLTMSGGYIVGNYATSDGGGLQVTRNNSGYFYMTGGHIANNTANSHGGGLTAYNVADISGGSITGNQCLGGNKTYYKEGGGAIQIEAQGKLSVSGDAIISGNKSAMSGGGILVWGDCSYFRLSGSPVIKDNTAAYGGTTYTDDNIRLNSSKTISISGALSCAEPIGVSVSSSSNSISGTGVFTSDWCTHMDGKDPADYFASDNANYGVILNGGEVEISVPPVASVISGDTTTNYGSFPDAVNAWLNSSDGATLKLLKDVSYNDKIILSNNKTRVLDLNGKTFTRTVPSGDGTVFDVNSAANFTLTDTSKEQTGIVTRQSGNYGGTVLFVRDSGSVINFNAGKLTGFTSRVIITWQGSTVNMTGGEISGNNLNNGDATDGIVRTYSSTSAAGGTFNMTGGRIVNNTLGSGKTGGAVYVGNNGTFNLFGDVEISGNTQNGNPKNVYLPAGNTINVTGALTGDKSICVTLQNGSGTFTSGWNTYMSGKDPADYFVSDFADYEVRLENGEAVANYPFVSGVTALGYTGDYDGKSHSISVSVPEGATVKYGTAEGTYTLSKAPAYTSAGTYNIYYKVSQNKRTDITGSVTVQINKINVTITITGHTNTVDYDGNAHSADGYDAVASSDLYDVTKDFTYSGRAEAVRTNAGTTAMGLKAEKFTNTNDNFETVTFVVTDGYLTVNKINVTVTITGHTNTVDYDGNAHSADGYDAVASSDLYDVTKDFTYSGRAEAVRTNAGTTAMGLKAELFENKNSNFSSVTFIVTDGYLTINTVDAVITTAPVSEKPIYNGSKLNLIVPGKSYGGTLYYALGDDPRNVPADTSFHTAIPVAKELGSYYVWYKVVADRNHNDVSPAYVKVVLADESWVTLSGVLYENDGKTPLGDSVVTLTKGNQQIDYVITDSNGNYEFIVPAGTYNIVANGHGVSATGMVKIFDNTSQDFVMSGGKTESIIKVNGDSNFGITAGGLNEEAYSIRKSGNIDSDTNVSVLMTVQSKADNTATNTAAFSTLMRRKSFMFFDVKLEATVGSNITVLKTTNNVLEIAVPYTKVNRRGLSVYYSDGSGVKSFKESDSKKNGTYSVDKKNGFIYIYSNQFSTFAIGYTPYYHVKSTVSLGSFKGNATVILDGQNGEGNFELKDIDLSKISFADIPKGEYKMSVTWKDGATNTLTMPITVS